MKKILIILNILDAESKRQLYKIFYLILIASILEVLGVGLIIPLMNIILDNNSHVFSLFSLEFNYILKNFEIYALFFFILFYFLKTIFLTYLSYKRSFFSASNQKLISSNLYSGYLKQNYSDHQNEKSSEHIRNITQDAILFSQVISAYLLLATEISVLIAIIFLLILFNTKVTILIFLITSIFSYFIFYIPNKKLKKWGEQRQLHDSKRIKFIQDAYSSFKEIKILSLEKYFIDHFNFHNGKSADIIAKNSFVGQLPRLFLEFFGVLCICIFASGLIYFNRDYKEIFTLIILYTVAGIRIMPSFNKIIISLQKIKFSSSAIYLLDFELNKIKIVNDYNDKKEKILFQKKIEITNLKFKYKDKEDPTLKSINITINYGETVGILGASGAGKSTLINLITGLYLPSDGFIKVDGVNIHQNINAWQSNIGYVPQNIYLSNESIKSNIAYGINQDEINENFINYALEAANLKNFVNELSHGIETPVGELGDKISGGQKQRIGIARALYFKPKLLILDEATNALDQETEKNVIEELRVLKGSITIIFVTHRLTTLALCDKIGIIKNGYLTVE
jgi:ABC-type multidrug transport system fused ATPase/permease subunit